MIFLLYLGTVFTVWYFRQHNDQKKYKGQRMVYKTLPMKLKIEAHESKAVNRGRTDYTMTKQRTKGKRRKRGQNQGSTECCLIRS
jgi:hypothetical protein